MRETLELSPTPVDEQCEQIGPNYRPEIARAECRAFIGQLRRMFGEEPAGATLKISSNPHDFGTYYEVAVRFDDENDAAVEYAYHLESNLPEQWDDTARRELGLEVRADSHLFTGV